MSNGQLTTDNQRIPAAVVLLSGGMDSATLLHYVKQELNVADIYALSILYGQTHAKELEMARWQAANAGVREHREINMESFGALIGTASALTGAAKDIPELADLTPEQLRQPPTYVPNRNMILLALAAAYAESVGAEHVFYGAQAQDEYGYWDCTADFVERMNHTLSLNRAKPITVHAPFATKSKREVAKIGLALGVDYDHTWTCYRGGDTPCGNCPSCVERASAFDAG